MNKTVTFCEKTKYNHYICELIATYIEFYDKIVENSNNSYLLDLISKAQNHFRLNNLFGLLQEKINEIRFDKQNNKDTSFCTKIFYELCHN